MDLSQINWYLILYLFTLLAFPLSLKIYPDDQEVKILPRIYIISLVFQVLIQYFFLFVFREVIIMGVDQAGEIRVFTQIIHTKKYSTNPLQIEIFDNYSLAIVPLLIFFLFSSILNLTLNGTKVWIVTYHLIILIAALIKPHLIFNLFTKFTSRDQAFVLSSLVINSIFFISPSWWIGIRESIGIIWILLFLLSDNSIIKRTSVSLLLFLTHYLTFFFFLVLILIPQIIKQVHHLSSSPSSLTDFSVNLNQIVREISARKIIYYIILCFSSFVLFFFIFLPVLSGYVRLIVNFLTTNFASFKLSPVIQSAVVTKALWVYLTYLSTIFGFFLFIKLFLRDTSPNSYDLGTIFLIFLLASSIIITSFGPERIFSVGIFILLASLMIKSTKIKPRKKKTYIFLVMLLFSLSINPLIFTIPEKTSNTILSDGESNFEDLILKTSVNWNEYQIAMSLDTWYDFEHIIYCDWNQFRAIFALTLVNITFLRAYQNDSVYSEGDYLIIPEYFIESRYFASVFWDQETFVLQKVYLTLNYTNLKIIETISGITVLQKI